MEITGILTEEGRIIKHLNPIRYRRLKQICKRYMKTPPENATFIVQLFHFKGQELHADLYTTVDNMTDFFDSIYEIDISE